MTITVVGLGKIGLPLAAQFASKGHTVAGADIDGGVVDGINRGAIHLVGEAGVEEAVRSAVAGGRLHATTDVREAVARSSAVVIIVPLTLGRDHQADFGPLDAASRSVAAGLQPDTLVVVETTVPVGTTRGRVGPLLEQGSGKRIGQDLFLAFSPERVYSGRILEDLRRYPKVVGGVDVESTQRALAFYRSVLDAEVIAVANAETAEFSKLAETAYRDVNIALANQLALYAGRHAINAREAFQVANSQPFSHLHTPGIGVGGHCIPVYPHFLLQGAQDGELGMLRVARETNDGMVEESVRQLANALGDLRGRPVLVLGIAYRENVKETAFSAALRLAQLLQEAGAQVRAHDPLFTPHEIAAMGVDAYDLTHPTPVDAVIVQAFHREYHHLDWKRFPGLRVVLDGRGALDPERLARTGARYLGIGVPG